MKTKLIFILLTFVGSIFAQDQVTIYNDNFSLVRTSLELNLEKGLQDYYLDDIPSTIEANSVIINSKNKLEIFSQNYEYDLANTNSILKKYINEDIEIVTEPGNFYGKLQFFDGKTAGIIDNTSKKLTLVNTEEIQSINLTELPDNFFLKPTLHWKLNAKKSGNYPIDFSYLCAGMKWDVTYNAVWNDVTEKLELNSWVTIDNRTGKAFADIKLKLIAGDVQKVNKGAGRQMFDSEKVMLRRATAPEFTEKTFHDFHLYTLNENVSINNNQTKQLRLFPTSSVKASSKYEYKTHSAKVRSIIEFTNSKKAGLGNPLPKGVVKIYKKDEADNQLEFIGEDRLDHTPTDEKIRLITGNAFDIVAKTEVMNVNKLGKRSTETDMSVTLKNRSKKSKTITIIHNIHGDWEIFKQNIPFKKNDAKKIEFQKKLAAGEEFRITWTQKVDY